MSAEHVASFLLSLSDISSCLTVSGLLLENPCARTGFGLKRELNRLWLEREIVKGEVALFMEFFLQPLQDWL